MTVVSKISNAALLRLVTFTNFVDIGEMLDPPGVVPVVIKSPLFA